MGKLDVNDLHWVRKAWLEPFLASDVLFRSVSSSQGKRGDWQMNAQVREADDYAYAEGYRLAGRILANYVIEERWDEDFLVYPIVFMYRHNVELQFKRMIPDAAFLVNCSLDRKDREMLVRSHRLDQLWGLLEPLLQNMAGLGVHGSEIEAIKSYVRQIHEIDELSFSFRYPTTTSGAPSLDHRKLPHINIGVLAACMERLTSYLYNLGESFREAVEAKCEMEAEARAEYASYMDSFEEYYDGD